MDLEKNCPISNIGILKIKGLDQTLVSRVRIIAGNETRFIQLVSKKYDRFSIWSNYVFPEKRKVVAEQ